MSGAENYYAILGISQTADDEIIKNAFREKAKAYHPDHNPGDAESERRFKQINTAYEALKDPSRRKAYDEWLSFARKRKRTDRRQWRRLLALFSLLLLGPSIVLSWLAFSGDAPPAATPGQQIAERPAAPDRAPPKPADAPARQAETGKTSPAADAGVKSDEPPKSAGPAFPDDEEPKEERKDASGETPRLQAPASPMTALAPSPPPAAIPPQVETAPAPADPTAKSLPQEAAPAAPVDDEPVTSSAPDPVETTQALPREVPGPDDPGAQIDGLSPPLPASHPNRRLASNAETVLPGGARDAARVIAALKEPESQDQSRQTVQDRQPGSFTDCEGCPLMSVAGRPERARNAGSVAISQGEITLAQWNICVRQGACPPYPRAGGNPSDPVIGLSARDANAYALWLSETTRQPYRIVMPVMPPSRRGYDDEGGERCADRTRRPRAAGWGWLEDDDDDGPNEDCPPSGSGNGETGKGRGFRVARRVENNG